MVLVVFHPFMFCLKFEWLDALDALAQAPLLMRHVRFRSWAKPAHVVGQTCFITWAQYR